jgi:osmoprotectant transport system permease protein
MSQGPGFLAFMISRRGDIFAQLLEHIGLTLTALLIAMLVGIPAGILLTRRKKMSASVLGIAGIIQTIPSVALLGLLLPLLGIGVVPAIVALFLYALLPIIRNTFTGIEEVDPAVREAARGMGMAGGQILRKVELPLAVPVIFAGIRTATVINVGIATLCALIGAGGLGEFIFRGIALNNLNMILAGALPAAALALLFDAVLALVQKNIARVFKPFLVVTGALILTLIHFVVVPALISSEFVAGFTSEFMERPDGYQGLCRSYGLRLESEELDPGLMYRALKNKRVDLICGFATDGRIKAYDLRILEDDRAYFTRYDAAPLVRGEMLRKHPELRDALDALSGRLNSVAMRELNYRVDHLKHSPEDVALEFVESLSRPAPQSPRPGPRIVIGSKNFTEQYILAYVFAEIIRRHTGLPTDLKTGLVGTKICFDALRKGEIDLYPEYSGTGWFVLLERDELGDDAVAGSPSQMMAHVREETRERFDLEWLNPLGFNNTYALMMREKHAAKLDIRSISDLVRYLQGIERR